MKGFDALAINTFRDAGTRELHAPLVLILTFDEEPGMLGAEHLVTTWKPPFELPRACLVGEPTCFQVVRMHRGHLKLRVILHGKTAHSGYPHLGVNAIEPAAPVMVALSALNETMKHERRDSSKFFPETPYVSLNLGRIHGGEAINVVPDRCVLEFGVRLLPDVSPEAVTARVKTAVESAASGASFTFETIGYSPSLLVDETAPFYRAMCELMDQRDTVAVSYATDGGMLQRLNMDCVVWGPGNIEVAHKANEHMPKADFVRARDVLGQVIQRHCG
jgi:acetylornithine deacetylase